MPPITVTGTTALVLPCDEVDKVIELSRLRRAAEAHTLGKREGEDFKEDQS